MGLPRRAARLTFSPVWAVASMGGATEPSATRTCGAAADPSFLVSLFAQPDANASAHAQKMTQRFMPADLGARSRQSKAFRRHGEIRFPRPDPIVPKVE